MVIFIQDSLFMTQTRFLFLCKHNCIFGQWTDDRQTNLDILGHYDTFIPQEMGLKIIWYLVYIQVSEIFIIYGKIKKKTSLQKEHCIFMLKPTYWYKPLYIQILHIWYIALNQNPGLFAVISKNSNS